MFFFIKRLQRSPPYRPSRALVMGYTRDSAFTSKVGTERILENFLTNSSNHLLVHKSALRKVLAVPYQC